MFSAILSKWSQHRNLKRRLKMIGCETLLFKDVASMIYTHDEALDRTRPIILQLVARAVPDDNSMRGLFFRNIVRYFLDRATSTPVSILRLVAADPAMAAPDVASLHRTFFEGSANLLFVLKMGVDEPLKSLTKKAMVNERRMHDRMTTWSSNSDKWISQRAKAQLDVIDPPTDESWRELLQLMGVNDESKISGFPNIRDRCRVVGPKWDYLYDSMYSGLSAWQHGDSSRATVCTTTHLLIPGGADRLVFESLIITDWTWELTHLLVRTLCELTGIETVDGLEEINLICKDASHRCLKNSQAVFHHGSSN